MTITEMHHVTAGMLSQKPPLGPKVGRPPKSAVARAASRWHVDEKSVLVVRCVSDKVFPGQYYDSETNLHYNYFRYYDPSIGRYITSDPIGLDGGFNTYLYANANPMIYIDPDGLLFGGRINAGESYGDSAAQYWADRQVATGNDLYAIPGALASLWTPDTSDATALTLLGGYATRVLGFFSPRGVPKYLQRLRKYLRFDSPHHGKGWQFDGTLPKKLRDLFGDKSNMFLPPLFPLPDYSSPDPIPDDIYDEFCRQNPSAPNCQNRCP